MNKAYIILFYLITHLCFAQKKVTTIYTDLNGYYKSNTKEQTKGSHNVIGFEWENKFFSTGVNDTLLKKNNPNANISNQIFKNFPTDSLAEPIYGASSTATNNIGLGVSSYEFANYTDYKQNNYRRYLADGINGLNIGTGIFNINLVAGEVKFNNITVNPSSINDNIPDILITQIGDPHKTKIDTYYFESKGKMKIGKDYNVAFFNVAGIFSNLYYFYELKFVNNKIVNIDDILTFNPESNINNGKPRDIRVLALDWSELGINDTNYSDIYSFIQKFSGASDSAFIAYNISSLKFIRTVSGTVNSVDKITLKDTPFPNADIEIYLVASNGVETKVGATKSDTKGYYEFKNLESNNAGEMYRVRLMNFEKYNPKYFVVNNKNGKTLDYLNMNLAEGDSRDNHFVLGKFCVGDWALDDNGPIINNVVLAPLGMTSHSKPIDNWPSNIPNSQLTLDSTTNGFVLTRIDARTIALKDLIEGMLIYDTIDDCLKLYDGQKWDCIERDCYHLVYDQNEPIYPKPSTP